MPALFNTALLLVYLLPQAVRQGGPPSNMNEPTKSKVVNMASSYVPIESWVYPAFDRLEAEGYLPDAIVGLRPWTRMACARFVQEAEDRVIHDRDTPSDVAVLLRSLNEEFGVERQQLRGGRNTQFFLDSVDQRSTSIAGRPLTDGYHFAETIVDDYGRPFGQGENDYTGLAVRATIS